MEGMNMLRLPQIVRWFATLALVCGFSAASNAVTSSGAQAKAKAATKKSAQAKPPAKTAKPGKTAAKASATAPVKANEGEAAAEAAPNAAAHRRDPFAPLVSATQQGPNIPKNLPPGKAGLMISTLRVDGVVRSSNGLLAVVTNPQQRTYFVRQGDRLYDGNVEQITMEGVSFKETGKDPFGKPIERVVTKRIYPSAGEQ
jgi:Tfp pilus assembly protein PilP